MLNGLLKVGAMIMEQQKPILIHKDRCTHQRHKASTCTLCVDECPLSAISIEDGVNIDFLCDGCGICTSVCPTETLELKTLPMKDFYVNIRNQVEDQDFVIFKSNDNYSIEDSILISSLGQIDDLAIQLAITNGIHRFYFLTNHFDTNEYKNRLSLFNRRLEYWKERWPKVQWTVTDYNGFIENTKEKPVEKQLDNLIDRREFFKTFGKGSKKVLVDIVKQKQMEKDSPWKNGALVSQGSIRLQVYEKWIKPKIDDPTVVIKNDLEFNDRCTFCGICENVCPTQAITIDGTDQHHHWEKEQCTDCRLCQDVCYRDAINFI